VGRNGNKETPPIPDAGNGDKDFVKYILKLLLFEGLGCCLSDGMPA
jgi:hypothetical protein